MADLIKLAALLNVTLDDKDTIPTIKKKVKPLVRGFAPEAPQSRANDFKRAN